MKSYITGIGGVFFKSENPDESYHWYKENLGLEANQWGKSFEWRDKDNAEQICTTQWCVFKRSSDYFGANQEFMINYRVKDLEELLESLVQKGIQPCKPMESHEYGKFAWIEDNNGIRMELWEPIDANL